MDEIVVALLCCLVLAVAARRLSLPPVPFYIVAGVIAGNYGLAALRTGGIAEYFSHLGLVFLLFYSGLEFRPRRFVSRGSGFLTSGVLDLSANLAIGVVGALALGFSPFQAFVVGAAFLDTSSAIAIASLIENKKLASRESETIVWLLIFEDLVMVFLIFFVSSDVGNPFVLLAKIAAAAGLIYLTVRVLSRRITAIVQHDDELPALLTVTAVLAAIAVAGVLGIPEAVPVIVLGSALSRTNPAAFERIVTPFRDVFLVIFFFFFGTTIDLLGEISLGLVLVVSLLAIAAKVIGGMAIGHALHRSTASGIEIGANTIAHGEFAIALAAIYGSGLVSSTIAGMVIVTSVVGVFTARYSASLSALIHPRP